ncbi:MAG TPA: phosphoribosylamine--glycine ligase [bacterium]|nr:phosphoribosylamine--glycine ligase [bacterium]
MRVLVVGGGGREHTICWKLSKSASVEKIYCAPGNPGIRKLAEIVDVPVTDIVKLRDFAIEKSIDLTIAGPELPLTLGINDCFSEKGMKVFGPSKAAAQLEGSKVFAKEFMKEMNIPSAEFETFEKLDEAINYTEKTRYPLVIKADGLAAGKGVLVTSSKLEAQDFLKSVMSDKVFGDSGSRVIIEDCLIGEETSIIAISDGDDILVLTPSQDHKRAYDNDEGPNTGGMGAYSPVSIVKRNIVDEIRKKALVPVVEGMKKRGHPFVGVIYAGMMLTADGPYVLEYNVRFGDPETQVVLPLIEGDFGEICMSAVNGSVSSAKIKPAEKSALCVVMASGGYPGSFEKGKIIEGIDEAEEIDNVIVFHAGTGLKNGKLVNSGGRVLGVTAVDVNLSMAHDKAYKAVEKIKWDGVHFRKDIGKRDLERKI